LAFGSSETKADTIKPITSIILCKKNKIRKHNYQLHYDAGYDIIHVDEKWFYLSKTSNQYYLMEDEEDPIHRTRHKGHILKI
jgi:hypothetical protein